MAQKVILDKPKLLNTKINDRIQEDDINCQLNRSDNLKQKLFAYFCIFWALRPFDRLHFSNPAPSIKHSFAGIFLNVA